MLSENVRMHNNVNIYCEKEMELNIYLLYLLKGVNSFNMLSFIKKHVGIVAIREISEVENRRKNTEHSYTFHGRDVYAYTGAKLASGHITFEEVGPELNIDEIVEIPVVETTIGNDFVSGAIDILDVRFGSLWTSIRREEFYTLSPEFGDRFDQDLIIDSR